MKIVPKAFSAKDEDLEEGVMWEQIPGGSSKSQCLLENNCSGARVFSVAISCFLELKQQNNASDSKSEHSLYSFELDLYL